MDKQSDSIGICIREEFRVRVGMEATGYSRWFERLLAELGFELWIGDPAEIKAKRVKKQKFDREGRPTAAATDAGKQLPQIWVPGPENRIYGNCCGTVIDWCRCARGS